VSKRKHKIEDLVVKEVSLCRVPANASINPETGVRTDHSVIAIYKADRDAQKEKQMSKSETFEVILKSASRIDQLAVQQVVEAPARIAKIMEERKCSEAIAKCFAWGREEQEAYELAKKSDISRLRAALDDDGEEEDDEDQKVSAKVARKVAKLREDNPSMDYSTAENQVLSSRPKLRAKYYAAVGVPMAGQPPKKRGSMVAA
jgi:hypothetical protein